MGNGDEFTTTDPAPETVAETRQRLLLTHAGIIEQLEQTRIDLAAAGPDSVGALLAAEDLIVAAAGAIQEEYRAIVPVVAVSRNPLNGEVVTQSIDFYGIDGWWWDLDSPVRPLTAPSPGLVAMTGALTLSDQVERTSFLVRPGPAVPFVIPEILSGDGVVAVVSEHPVGDHLGYLIMYFAVDYPPHAPRANDWASNTTRVVESDGSLRWSEEFHLESDYDFDLRPWLEEGSLFWIAGGDDDLVLRRGVADCPYLDLPGTRMIQRVRGGEVWDSSDVY